MDKDESTAITNASERGRAVGSINNGSANLGIQTNFNIQQLNIQVNNAKDEKPISKFPVFDIRKPVWYFEETETYTKIYECIHNVRTVVLHCWGFPGSGKSEIVLMLAKKFPFCDQRKVIRCHIQCKDSKHNIGTELQKLAKTLLSHGMLSENEFQNIHKDLEKRLTKKLMVALKQLGYPAVIIIEDPPGLSKEQQSLQMDLLHNFLTDAIEYKDESNDSIVHVYVTTCEKSLAPIKISNQNLNHISCNLFIEKQIKGFTETESLNYLCFVKPATTTDDTSKTLQEMSLDLINLKILYYDAYMRNPKCLELHLKGSELTEESINVFIQEKYQKVLELIFKDIPELEQPCCIRETVCLNNCVRIFINYNYDEEEHKQEIEAMRKVYKHYIGLPLCLHAVKSYCTNSLFTYTDYLDFFQVNNNDMIDDEAMEKGFVELTRDFFQAIVRIFTPLDQSASASTLNFKVLCCLSYFNYDRIPTFLINDCFLMIRDKAVKPLIIKNDVGQLIKKLKDNSLCSEITKNDITFHEVVSNAFRFFQHKDDSFRPLPKAIEIMCKLVLKYREEEGKKKQLHLHLQTLLTHINTNKTKLLEEYISLSSIIDILTYVLRHV